MFNKFVDIDFEYNGTKEKKLNVVCSSVLVDGVSHNFWLHKDDKEKERLASFLFSLQNMGYLFSSYAAEAEASALLSMFIDPLKFKWMDLHLEIKMLYNHNLQLTTGKHLIDGKIKHLKPFGEKPSTSLASSLYKFCGILIDSEHKDKMRKLIISAPDDFTPEERTAIMQYCESDTRHMPALREKVFSNLMKYIPKSKQANLPKEIINRAEYSVRTAMMVRHGTPINVQWAKNLAANAPLALLDCIQDINSQFPDNPPFRFDKSKSKYVMNTKMLRHWISAQKFAKWELTEGGVKGKKEFSLKLEAWEEYFPFRHDFPRENLGAQMVRYLKLKQSLNSFNFKEGQATPTFFDSLGSDGFSRPYMNHFGAQSSRSQPKSSGFLFLKSAWMRAMCQPPEGYAIGGIDYSSEEFFLSALCSMDRKMIQAYLDGDPYLYYGKGIGLIPKDGTKESHSFERDLCKGTVLGLSYLMTKVGLSKKLTADLGKFISEEEADKLVDGFDNLFDTFSSWREAIVEFYQTAGYLVLPDGWYMFKDNPNFRSSANMPLQGAGAAIMRKAVQLAQDKGLNIIFTLHDALYIMSLLENIQSDMDTLRECMKEAFVFYFQGEAKELANNIRMDGKVWGPSFSGGQVVTTKGFKLETSKYHIDKRAKAEYDLFSKFFTTSPGLDLI